ncbi:MAG: LysM peptidoglycan-binding domain-containing protein [Methyloceanibacter sp.]
MSPDGTRALLSQQSVQVAVGKAQGEAVAQKEASKSTEARKEEAAPAPSGNQQIATAEEPKPEETTETKPEAASSAASPEEAKPELPAETSPAVGPEPSVAPEAKEAEQPASSTKESKPTDATEAAPQGSEASAETAEKAESSGAPERPKQPEGAKKEPAAPQAGASPPAPPTPAVTAQQPSEAERPEPKKAPVEFKSVDYQDTSLNSGKVSLTGTGDPGARILLFSDKDPLGQVSVGSDGTWAFEREKKLANGEHTFRADRIDEGSGIVIGQASVGIVRMEKPAEPSAEEHAATPTPSAPSPGAAPGAAQAASQPAPQVAAGEEAKPAATGGRKARRTRHRPKVYTVRRGDTLWEVAESYFGGGWHYRAIVRDNRRKIHNPNWIYPRQTFHMPAR